MVLLSKTGSLRIIVTLRHVITSITVVEKKYELHIVSVYVALVILHGMRMCYIVISVLPRSTGFFFNFFTFSHKLHDFRGKKLLNTKCLF